MYFTNGKHKANGFSIQTGIINVQSHHGSFARQIDVASVDLPIWVSFKIPFCYAIPSKNND